MTDFHHNIFYYYRGPQQSKQGLYDQQLEDNTTKALVNTLKHCSPTVVSDFLEHLGMATNGKKIVVELQKPTIGTEKIRRTSQRLLLGLVDKPENKGDSNKSDGVTSRDSRPDAWLYGEDFVVLIESKVGKDPLKLDQMQHHSRKLQKDARQPPKYQVRTWAEVHKFFVRLLPELRDKKDKWLVEQFTQYLEWQGMTEFVGFEEGMFEFFVHDKKDADTKKWIRNTMGLFAEKVLSNPNGLQALNAMFYRGYRVGNFGAEDDHFWVAFGPKKFREVAHQTIALYDYGLDVFVNVELSPAIKKLKKKIWDEKQKFRTILSELPGPFRVQVEERKLKQASIYDYYVVANLEGGVYKDYHPGHYGLKDPQSNGFNYLETLLEQIQFPYLSVRKRIDRKQVLELSKGNEDALVNEVLGIMKEFHPLVEFINE